MISADSRYRKHQEREAYFCPFLMFFALGYVMGVSLIHLL